MLQQLDEIIIRLLDYSEGLEESRLIKFLRTILHRVANELNKVDWSRSLKITDDFVVTALDSTNYIPPKQDLKESIPQELIQKLKKKKLFP